MEGRRQPKKKKKKDIHDFIKKTLWQNFLPKKTWKEKTADGRMNAGKVLADTEHSYVQRRQGGHHEKGFGGASGHAVELCWQYGGWGLGLFFFFFLIFIFQWERGRGLFRGFTVPTDSGVGTPQESKKLQSYIHFGSYSCFFLPHRLVGWEREETKWEKLKNGEKKKGGVRENLWLTLRNQETTTRKTKTEKYIAYVQMHILYTESTRLPRSLLR